MRKVCWYSGLLCERHFYQAHFHAALNASLPEIVLRLMTRFSSKEGYKAFDDALPVRQYAIFFDANKSLLFANILLCYWNEIDHRTSVRYLDERLNVPTAIVSNADSRIRMSSLFESHSFCRVHVPMRRFSPQRPRVSFLHLSYYPQ